MKAEDLDFLREFLIRLLSKENYDTMTFLQKHNFRNKIQCRILSQNSANS